MYDYGSQSQTRELGQSALLDVVHISGGMGALTQNDGIEESSHDQTNTTGLSRLPLFACLPA